MSPKTRIGWAVLEVMGDGKLWLLSDLVREIGSQAESIASALKRLALRGLIKRVEGVYQLTAKGFSFLHNDQSLAGTEKGSLAKRHGLSLRAKAWRVMQMKDWFSVDDILLTICDGSEKSAEINLRRYFGALKRAGYLASSAKRGENRYRLINNTGLQAPSLNNVTRTLTDANTYEVFNV